MGTKLCSFHPRATELLRTPKLRQFAHHVPTRARGANGRRSQGQCPQRAGYSAFYSKILSAYGKRAVESAPPGCFTVQMPPCQETLTFEGLLRWKSVAERSLTQRTTLSGNLYKTRRFITAGGGCVPPRCTTFVVPQRTFSRMPASQSSKRPRPHRFHPGGGRWTHLAQAHGRRKQKRHAGSISIIGELVAIGRMRTAACSSRSTRPLHLRLHLRLRGARHWKRPSTYARTSRAPRFPRPTGYPPVRRTNRQA